VKRSVRWLARYVLYWWVFAPRSPTMPDQNLPFELCGVNYRTDHDTLSALRSIETDARRTGDSSAVAALMALGLRTGRIVACEPERVHVVITFSPENDSTVYLTETGDWSPSRCDAVIYETAEQAGEACEWLTKLFLWPGVVATIPRPRGV
jgi:hypothetical protein